MTIGHLIAFNVALFAAIASPGPALLTAIQTALNSGRKARITVGYGLGVRVAVWAFFALLGLEAILQLM